jgi:hypothetical protein
LERGLYGYSRDPAGVFPGGIDFPEELYFFRRKLVSVLVSVGSAGGFASVRCAALIVSHRSRLNTGEFRGAAFLFAALQKSPDGF